MLENCYRSSQYASLGVGIIRSQNEFLFAFYLLRIENTK